MREFKNKLISIILISKGILSKITISCAMVHENIHRYSVFVWFFIPTIFHSYSHRYHTDVITGQTWVDEMQMQRAQAPRPVLRDF